MEELLKNLFYVFDLYSLIKFFIFVGIFFVFIHFFYKKEVRLFRNRKRPIMIFKSNGQDMESEYKLLKDSGLFTIKEEPVASIKNLDRLNGHGLIIVGYTKNMQGFKKIVETAQNKRIPLLIYTKHDELDRAGDDFKVLTGYSYHSICNLPLRLVNDVFTVLSTFPHNKNNNFNL